jgi:hypothetical protein
VTDGLDQAIAQAGLTLLVADAGLVVYDGVVPPAPTPPYVVVYTTVSRPSDDSDNSGDGRTRVWVARWICHCVGANAVSARAVAQRVRTQLLDVRPTVTGLACGLIRMDGEMLPAQRDESTGVPVMDAVATFQLRATS